MVQLARLWEGGEISFGGGLAILLFWLAIYYGRERSFLHRNVMERLFWPCTWAWAAYVLILHPESPLHRLGSLVSSEGFANSVVVGFAAFCGVVVRESNQAARMHSLFAQASLPHCQKKRAETMLARRVTARISDVLLAQKKYSSILTSIFKEVWHLITDKTIRQQEIVLNALQECYLDDLLYVLNSEDIDVALMFAVAGTEKLFDFLKRHVACMDVETKGRLIDALHRQPDFAYDRCMQELSIVMLKHTVGNDLSTLKGLLDEGGDFYNLHKLIFQDLTEDLRETALRHIREEGSRMLEDGANPNTHKQVKVLSDIDDTLFSSGGKWPAGADVRFPKRQIYPGVLALFRELGRGLSDSKEEDGGGGSTASVPLWLRKRDKAWEEISVSASETVLDLKDRILAKHTGEVSFLTRAGVTPTSSNLAFLSARPHAYKNYSERKSYKSFKRLFHQGAMHCMPTLLAGRLRSSAGAALKGTLIRYPNMLNAFACGLFAFLTFNEDSKYDTHTLSCAAFALLFALVNYMYRKRTLRTNRWSHVGETFVWCGVGQDKALTFIEYQQLYPECFTLLFGDNGQGDLFCGEELARIRLGEPCLEMQVPELPGVGSRNLLFLKAVFIHEVVDRKFQLTSLEGKSADEQNAEWRRLNIYFHRTYIGAAINAFECGMITQEGLSRVGRAAVDDFVRFHTDCGDKLACAWQERVAELNDDVVRANMLLKSGLEIQAVPKAKNLQPSDSMESFVFKTPSLSRRIAT